MNYLRLLIIAVLLACGTSCGDDDPDPNSEPDASDPEAGRGGSGGRDSVSGRGGTGGRGGVGGRGGMGGRGGTGGRGGVGGATPPMCPASDEPAVPECPCNRPNGKEYCCGVGHGVFCQNGVWITFHDSPCAPLEDGGFEMVEQIECRR